MRTIRVRAMRRQDRKTRAPRDSAVRSVAELDEGMEDKSRRRPAPKPSSSVISPGGAGGAHR